MLRNHKSLKELVGFVDTQVKPALTTEAKQLSFGKNDEPIAIKTQSKTLQEDIATIRGK